MRVPGRCRPGSSAPPPSEPSPPKPLAPSRPSGPEPATLSPLAVDGRDRFKRGLLVHRLLQSLPELPEPERETAARAFLALPVHALTPEEQDEIRAETHGGADRPRSRRAVGAGIAGRGAGRRADPRRCPGASHALSGQIDRVVVTRTRVLVVDFKTVRPVPASEEEVPASLSAAARDVPRRARPHLSRPPDRMRAAVDRRAAC